MNHHTTNDLYDELVAACADGTASAATLARLFGELDARLTDGEELPDPWADDEDDEDEPADGAEG